MMARRIYLRAVLFVLTALLAPRTSVADFVRLESLLEGPATSLAGKLQGVTTVIAVRNGIQAVEPWDIPDAIAVELAAALRRRGVNAILAASDGRFEKLESTDHAFTANQSQSLQQFGCGALVGVEWLTGKKPRLKLTAFAVKSRKPLATVVINVAEDVALLENNIPPANRDVVGFAQKSLGKKVREGDCTHLAEDGLKAAGKTKRGIYRWGRELEPREPWLPGDIVQMERLTVKAPGFSRELGHHTAVVEEAHKDRIVVLHQNAYPKGQIGQRETWPIAAIRGQIVAYALGTGRKRIRFRRPAQCERLLPFYRRAVWRSALTCWN